MKKIALFSLVCWFAISCSPDKKSQLDKLKKQKEKIEKEIALLESAQDSNRNNNKKLILVNSTTVVPQEFNHFVEVQGKVDGEENIAVSSKMMGVVTQVYVKEGDFVRKGQILAELDAEVLKTSLKELESALAFVTDLYEKQKNLWEKKIGSEVQYLSAKNNKESMENKLKTLKEQLDLYKITSPINGTVEEVNLRVGQAANPGMPVFRVVNFSRVKVVADISEVYTAKVKIGAEAIIEFPDLNTTTIAKVTFTSRYINPVNRTFLTEIRLPSNSPDFRANMIAVVKINDYKAKDAIVIPVNIIQSDATGKFVYVVDGSSNRPVAKKRYIKEGQSYNGLLEVKDGLQANDKLITSGFDFLADGSAIRF